MGKRKTKEKSYGSLVPLTVGFKTVEVRDRRIVVGDGAVSGVKMTHAVV